MFGEQRVDEGRFSKAVDQAYRDPLLNAKRKQVTWEKRDKTKPKPPQQRDMSWLSGFATAFAFLAEWGLWILVGGLVLILLLTLRHWLPWMRGSLRRHKPLPTEVETEALQLPETLPDNVPAEARRLWTQGKPRHALALLYRASVETMAAARAKSPCPPAPPNPNACARRDECPMARTAACSRGWCGCGSTPPMRNSYRRRKNSTTCCRSLQRRYRWAA